MNGSFPAMTTDAVEKILAMMWQRSRFASYFFQSVQFVSHDSVPTLAMALRTGRLVMYYNKNFVSSINPEEMIGLLVHEMMHIVLNHDHRGMAGDDPALRNLAQDMVVNSFLLSGKSGFFSKKDEYAREQADLLLPPGLPVVPGGFTAETGIRDPSWEDLYRWLRGISPQRRKNLPLSESDGDGIPLSLGGAAEKLNELFSDIGPLSFLDESSMSLSFEGMKGILFTDGADRIIPSGVHLFHEKNDVLTMESKRNRLMAAAGNDVDCLRERFFQEITGIIERISKTDVSGWRRLLQSIVDYSSQSNEWHYTYGRFNRRYFSGGIYAPGRVFKEQMVITVAVDVSGSMVMNPGDIGQAFGAIEELLGKYRVHLVCLDEDVFIPELRGDIPARGKDFSRPCVYRKGDWRMLKTGSGGTTLFAPLFNRYMRGHRETLVVITDGYIYDLEALKRYTPTVWVLPQGRDEPFTPPFGRSVVMS